MNIIRTKALELSTIPAITYKQKLVTGGAGVKIIRLDCDSTAVLTLDKKTGGGVPYGKIDEKLFPTNAIKEAFSLTVGLPYSARGKITVIPIKPKTADEDVVETDVEKTDMVESAEYKAIVKKYIDDNGRLDYQRMNKDFIQFADKSKTIGTMLSSGAKLGEILIFVVKSRATLLSGKKRSLSDAEISALIETLDEINTRSAFKELNAHLKKMLSSLKR